MFIHSEYCRRVLERKFGKSLFMTKKDYKNFEKSTEGWSCINRFKERDIKVKDHDTLL